MKRLLPTLTAVLAIAIHIALPQAPRALAQGETPPAGGAAKPEKVTGVVKLDIEETLDKKPFRDTPTAVKLRKKLRELGFKVWTEKPLYVDEYEKHPKDKAGKDAKPATPTAAPAASADEKPTPDLIVKGKVVIGLDRTSKFFGGDVAFMYASTIELAITDKDGKGLAKVSDKDEWGKSKEKDARDDEIRRTIAFATIGVLKSDPVQARLSEKTKAAVTQYCDDVAKNYPRRAPPEQQPQDGSKEGDGNQTNPPPTHPSGNEGGEKKQ